MYYGNEQSQYTMNRAAYGDVAASMMMGGSNVMSGAAMGMNNMLSDIGRTVMPVGYMPPARVNVGFYGQYQQQTGFFSSGAGVVGLGGPGRSQMAADYMYNTASDFGERVGGGAAGIGSAVGSMGVGSIMGRVLGGGIVGSLAGGMIGSMAASTVMDAVGQRREISNYLENTSYRYITPGSNMADGRRGGMSAGFRQQTTEMIRQMDIKDPFTSTEDLTMILQQGTQKGMFAGTQNMEDFKKKFKELTDTVKTVTRTLNQSLEEAMTTVKELKSIGVDPGRAKAMVGLADTTGRMAGRTGAEMLNIGLQGAEFFRGTGIEMGIGAQATMMNLAAVRAGRDAGQISTETVAQAGGEEALAMRMNASGLAFAQSTVGRGFGAAFFQNGLGATGFNQGNFMQQMMGGGMGMVGLASTAAGNLSSPAALISYQANQEKFMTEAGKTFGGQGLQMMQMMTGMAQGSFLSGATGAKFEDSFRLALKQQGLSQPEIDTMIGNARGAQDVYKSANASAQQAYQRGLVEEGYRSNSLVNFGSQVRDLGKSAVDVLATPISNMIDGVKNSVINFTEEQAYGVRRANIGGINLSRTIAGGKGGKITVKSLDEGGALFGTTSGEALDRALTDDIAATLGIKKRSVSGEGDLREGEVIINKGLMGDTAINMADLKKLSTWNISAEDIKKAQVSGALNKVVGGTLDAIMASPIKDVNSAKDLMMAAYGKTDLSKDQAMKLVSEMKGTAYEKYTTQLVTAASRASTATDAVSAESVILAQKNYESADSRIRMAIAQDWSSGSLVVNSKAKDLSGDAIQLIASAANTRDSSQRDEAMNKAAVEIMKTSGVGKTEAMDMVRRGMKDTASTEALATAHSQLKSAQLSVGNDALSTRLISAAKNSNMSNAEVTKTENVALALGSAKTPEEFMRVTEANSSILKKTGMGQQILSTKKILDKVSGLESGDVGDLQEMLKKGGIGYTEDMGKLLRSGDTSGLKGKILDSMKASQAGTSFVNSPGGMAGAEGGPNAAQTLEQQVNINQQILAAMTQLANRLGPAR